MDEKIDQHDVAKYLGAGTKTVWTLIQRGELPSPIRIGRKQFWLKDKFTRWLHADSTASVRALDSDDLWRVSDIRSYTHRTRPFFSTK